MRTTIQLRSRSRLVEIQHRRQLGEVRVAGQQFGSVRPRRGVDDGVSGGELVLAMFSAPDVPASLRRHTSD